MKHTYLYPLAAGEEWLWRAARMEAGDLFGLPDTEEIRPLWVVQSHISDAIGEARDELHKRLESRDRICVGRYYLIPGSLDEGAQERGREADPVVRYVTAQLWDAPHFYGITYANVLSTLRKAAGVCGRDEWGDIAAFCKKYRATPDDHHRVVPVWM